MPRIIGEFSTGNNKKRPSIFVITYNISQAIREEIREQEL